ncbi:hypothetical protein NXW71_20555 [Parabacteroides merdae]|nr:hypothetical protein [Parabacteroides merdae]
MSQQIAKDKGKKIIVCIDEFQNINEYEDSLGFQRKPCAHWQTHTSVSATACMGVNVMIP